MTDTAADRPVKARITQTAQQRWLEQARQFVRNGDSGEAVDDWLQAQGCPPRLRQELLAQAAAAGRDRHRGDGLRVLAAGLAVSALGVAVRQWATHDGVTRLSGRLEFWGLVIGAVGVMVALVGGWKMLTGSSVDLTSEMH